MVLKALVFSNLAKKHVAKQRRRTGVTPSQPAPTTRPTSSASACLCVR